MKNKTLGFTLVEMLVSISIFAIVTAVVLIRNNEFNSGILFSNLVYEIALSIREMQTYGITVRASDLGRFDNGYGVYFNISDTEKSSFIQFTDIPDGAGLRNQIYDTANSNEKLFKLNLKPGNFICKICLNDLCASSVDNVSISFIRPEPDAVIKSTDPLAPTTINKAVVMIRAPGTENIQKSIVVTSVGQISVENGGSCTP